MPIGDEKPTNRELGLAYAAAGMGKEKQAVQTLKRAELVLGQFDHPLVRQAKCEVAAAALAHSIVPAHGVTLALDQVNARISQCCQEWSQKRLHQPE